MEIDLDCPLPLLFFLLETSSSIWMTIISPMSFLWVNSIHCNQHFENWRLSLMILYYFNWCVHCWLYFSWTVTYVCIYVYRHTNTHSSVTPTLSYTSHTWCHLFPLQKSFPHFNYCFYFMLMLCDLLICTWIICEVMT